MSTIVRQFWVSWYITVGSICAQMQKHHRVVILCAFILSGLYAVFIICQFVACCMLSDRVFAFIFTSYLIVLM